MKQRNSTKITGSLYLLACLILLLGFSPFTVAQAAPDSPTSYQVVFDPEDGSSYKDWHKVNVPEGGKITDRPADPQKEGFVFEGWAYAYEEDGSPMLWNFETDVVSENTTLWAVWEKPARSYLTRKMGRATVTGIR
ncbi:InlB B-repeat-containing protein [Eubacterium limosum]|uniref:InlB B-repeat-containing protein n=1 Tax=Eubacterium limosum TaxID=1736 RepID=UPI0022E2E83C|nr:InlB B-repeat-containing protein [Eubacterium limosum]